MKPHIRRSLKRTKIEHLDPVSVSTHGPGSGATLTGRDSKGIAVSVYVPQYILDAMVEAQKAVSDSPAKSWHCAEIPKERTSLCISCGHDFKTRVWHKQFCPRCCAEAA